MSPYFPDDLRHSAWHLRRNPGIPSVSGFALAPATVTLNIQSAAEQAEAITEEAEALYATGTINAGQTSALKLTAQDSTDVGKVKAFLNKVNAFVRGGVLTAEEAGPLLAGGNALLASLTTG